MWGPAAAVDTQTAAESQWVRQALETEAENFLTFVQTQVQQQATAEGGISFDTLLPPTQHSRVVATQAFMHVLSLASRGFLQVQQDDVQGFGELSLNVAAAQ